MIEAFGEQLITIDELRARMPELRARETNLRNQIEALDSQLADREAYLTLATDLEGFLAQLHSNAEVATVTERQRVLRHRAFGTIGLMAPIGAPIPRSGFFFRR
jgi:site-specific DNA recombinase